MAPHRPFPARLIVLTLLGASTLAAQTDRPDIGFTTNVSLSITANVGTNAVFVAGSSASLGAWDITKAPQLRKTGVITWKATVALPLGTNTQYRFFQRPMASGDFGSTNVTWLGAGNSNFTPPNPPPAPYAGKTICYRSGWTNANILWRQTTNDNDWVNTPMTRLGAGRAANEFLYGVTVGQAGLPIEFVPNNGEGGWDNAFSQPNSNYLTPLDFLYLQDGNVFNYVPPAAVSEPRFVTNYITSGQPDISSRNVRALLPRGYDQNPNKHYPVLYMHDGQSAFDPGDVYGSWSADATARREIQMGRMRETIIVAIDNTSARLTEYCPPQDQPPLQGAEPKGTGDQYRDFIINNVRPWVDYNFRTLNDPPNTGIMGSSLGGLISHYIATTTSVFGLAAPMSPSYWYAPLWTSSFKSGAKPANRIFYFDWGTDESDGQMWTPAWSMIDNMNSKGFGFNDDFYYLIGVGQPHNEAAWASRLPFAFRYLYDIRREPNAAALAILPPNLPPPATTLTNNTRQTVFNFPVLGRATYQLQGRASLQSGSWTTLTNFTTAAPWGNVQHTHNAPANEPAHFYQLKVTWPAP